MLFCCGALRRDWHLPARSSVCPLSEQILTTRSRCDVSRWNSSRYSLMFCFRAPHPPQRRCFNKRAPSPSFSRSLPTRSAAASSRTWRDLAAPLFRSSLGRRLAYFGSAPDARPVPMPSRASPDSTAPARRYLYPIVLRRVWGKKQRPRSNGQEATAMTADQRQGLDLSP